MKTSSAQAAAKKWFIEHGPAHGLSLQSEKVERLCCDAYLAGREAGEADKSAMQEYFEHARRELFPKVKASAIDITILGEPDPKLCMELGAAILFDKPILVLAPGGRKVPLALRTIAHKVIEDADDMNNPKMQKAITDAVHEMMEMARFRPQHKE